MTLGSFPLVPPGLADAALFLVLGSVSAGLVSMAKAGFGGSIGLLSVPLMIYACGEQTQLALGIMLPILIACDQVSIVGWWRKWDFRAAAMLLPGAIGGIGLGTVALWALRRVEQGHVRTVDASIGLGIGVIALGFVGLQLLRSLRKDPLPFRPVLWQASAVGAAAGLTSTLAHAGGPVVTMYLLPQQMPKGRFVATTVLYYWAGNLLKVPTYVALGLLNYEALRASVLLVPAVVAGALLGIFLHHRFGQRSFTGVVYVLLTLAGADLVRKAVGTLAG